MRDGSRAKNIFQQRSKDRAVLHAPGIAGETAVLRNFRLACNFTKFPELCIVSGCDNDISVGTLEHLRGRYARMHAAVSRRHYASTEIRGSDISHRRHPYIQQPDVDVLAFPSLPAMH